MKFLASLFVAIATATTLAETAAGQIAPTTTTTTQPPSTNTSCAVTTSCSGHAVNVSGLAPQCMCQCRNGWFGFNCGYCPSTYNASLDCTTCTTTPATGSSSYPNCPPARICNLTSDCLGRGISVVATAAGCNCTCRNGWFGPYCAYCPPTMDSSQDCAACLPGYVDYPKCVLANCTVTDDCSGHALRVVGYRLSGCQCTCRNSWTGPNCSTCPAGFNAGADCGTCLANFSGYPTCVPQRNCSVAVDCSGHAWSVAPMSYGTASYCNCTCRNSWAGQMCNYCPWGVDPAQDCGACSQGFSGTPPYCQPAVCTLDDCSGHATNVTGYRPQCTCRCRNAWTGANCSVCPAAYIASFDCSACANGVAGPSCAPPNTTAPCDSASFCSGKGSAVLNGSSCVCKCRNAWVGANCGICPFGVDPTMDCGVCMSHYSNYPACMPIPCNVTADCNGRGVNVSGTAPLCVCQCRNAWAGMNCSYCPANFAGSDCGECAAGYTQYPYCYPMRAACNVSTYCSDKATSVAPSLNGGCNCTCRNAWYGLTCAFCPYGADAGQDCAACVAGYSGFPNCMPSRCSMDNCGPNAANVTGYLPYCSCTCRNQWSGPNCTTCPALFDPMHDCGACVAGLANYPTCVPSGDMKCNVTINCNGRATSVSTMPSPSAANPGGIVCNCSCRNSWTGMSCAMCPTGVDPNQDCGACIPGFSGYPLCRPTPCNVETDCTGHAVNVSGSRPQCMCQCRNRWNSANCSYCPTGFDPAQDCGACAANFTGYPFCMPQHTCTIATDCMGHATSVTAASSMSPTSFSACNCTCRNQWSGPYCGTCPFGVDPNLDCGVCIPGFSGYPMCRPTPCTFDDCSGHATNVTGLRPQCMCQCRNAWSGADCSKCPARFDAAQDCGACAANFTGYPFCMPQRVCNIATDCMGHATSVTAASSMSPTSFSACNCTCRNQWSGPYCGTCPFGVDPNLDCGACIPGFSGYPMCRPTPCTVETDCAGHAVNVSGTQPQCMCQCRNQWMGRNCSYCSPKYDPTQDCGACAVGLSGYPLCEPSTAAPTARPCSIAVDCSGNALSVVSGTAASGGPSCTCKCINAWAGPNCGYCPVGFNASTGCASCASGYSGSNCQPLSAAPTAPPCTFDDCSNHATQVLGNRPQCACYCRNAWAGGRCGECPTGFNATADCATCSTGFGGYPSCAPVCDLKNDCSGHATLVRGVRPNCQCLCRNAWTGAHCDTCPVGADPTLDCGACLAGFAGYPNCAKQTCDCSTNATIKPCCVLGCIAQSTACAPALIAPGVNLAAVRDTLGKCDLSASMIWCPSVAECVTIWTLCPGLVPMMPAVATTYNPTACTSSGSVYCAVLGRCIQPLQEACALATTLVPQCDTSKGYSWCATLARCVLTFSEPCPTPSGSPAPNGGGILPGEKCNGAAGYVWCAALSQCLQPFKTPCPTPTPATTTPPPTHSCSTLVPGYVWCDRLQSCTTPAACSATAGPSAAPTPAPTVKCPVGQAFCARIRKCLAIYLFC